MKEKGKAIEEWRFQVSSYAIRGSDIKDKFLQGVRDHGRVIEDDKKTKKLQLKNDTKKATWTIKITVSDCHGQGNKNCYYLCNSIF
jgi:hypothetical protein